MPVSQVLEALGQGLEARIVQMLTQPAGNLDLYLLRLFPWIRGSEHGLEQVGVQHQGFEVVLHRFYVHVLVDQLDGLGPQLVPVASRK